MLAAAQFDSFYPEVDTRHAAAISDVVVLSDGSHIVRGRFEWVSGQRQVGYVRLLANGQPDQVFNAHIAPFSEQIVAVVEAPGRKLLVAHEDYSIWKGDSIVAKVHKGLMRLNWDGSPDPTFARPPNKPDAPWIYSDAVLAALPSGEVLLAGWLAEQQQAGAKRKVPLLRLRPNGQIDASFLQHCRQALASSDSCFIQALQVLPNGSILLGGRLAGANGQPPPPFVRLFPDGRPDAAFKAAPNSDYFQRMAVQPNGSVLALFNDGGGNDELILRRLLPNGLPDPTFPARLTLHSRTPTVQVQPDGRILLLGTFEAKPEARVGPGVMRLLPSGKPDPSWQPSPDQADWATALQLLPGGEVLVGGEPHKHGRAETDALPIPGEVLTATGAFSRPYGELLQGNGRVKVEKLVAGGWLVYGAFLEINGLPARNIARLHPNGSLDSSFITKARTWHSSPADREQVYRVKPQPDGSMLIWGSFNRVGTLAKAGLARLQPSGSPDPSYPPAPSPPMPPELAEQLIATEWLENPIDSVFLYRNCRSILTPPFFSRSGKPMLNYKGLGGEVNETIDRIILTPAADKFTLLAYRGKQLVFKYRFAVKPVPTPAIRCILTRQGSPVPFIKVDSLSQSQLLFYAIPEPTFAAGWPEDARFRVSRARATLLRNNVPVGEPLLFVQEGLQTNQHNKMPLASVAALARPGDLLRVEVTAAQRLSAEEQLENFPLAEQFTFQIK